MIVKKTSQWLETHWVNPAYSAYILGAIAIALFGAATNTMAGWLYVISGMIFSLLLLGAILPNKALKKITIRRLPITPVSANDQLTIELEIHNLTHQPKNLLQIQDNLPYLLAKPEKIAIEFIPPKSSYRWVYYPLAKKRGIYQWQEVELRTANPIGLFWCKRGREVPAKAVVYPMILPLSHCPLIDNIGKDENLKLQSQRQYLAANEGITKTLRQYRQGDPIRLIHWRSSARFGHLQVRELEIITGGQEVIIALDTASGWDGDIFEIAVTAAASLYFYANRCQLNVQLWTAATGLIHGNRVVLETLAATQPQEDGSLQMLPNLPVIWLTQSTQTLSLLTFGSRWLIFSAPHLTSNQLVTNTQLSGLIIDSQELLAPQLQKQF